MEQESFESLEIELDLAVENFESSLADVRPNGKPIRTYWCPIKQLTSYA